MRTKQLPSIDYLQERLSYEPTTGVFYWKKAAERHFATIDAAKAWNSRRAGQEAGTVNDKGYVCIRVAGVSLRAHRLAWAMKTGAWPEREIDHRNLNKADNRYTNLREAGHAQNLCNTDTPANNTSGVKGVSFARQKQKFQAYIGKDNRLLWLGSFASLDDAAVARQQAQVRLHGEFARVAAA